MPALNKNKGDPSKKTSVPEVTPVTAKIPEVTPVTVKPPTIKLKPAQETEKKSPSAETQETEKISVPKTSATSVSSPLRQRLKQRIEENTVEFVEEKPKNSSSTKGPSTKGPSTAPKKIPKVFASPSWFKSPRQKKNQTKNKQFDELRDLFRKDGNNTEEGINKIINDLKF
jgi:hypothetical protein